MRIKITGSWKTTSAGAAMILGVLVHLVFAIKNDTLTEADVTIQIPIFLGGIGLMFSRDADKTSEQMGLNNTEKNP